MAYCALADLYDQIDERELIQLTDDENLGIVDQGAVDKAITDADGEIDGYLGSRHSVPLSPIPSIINKISVDIAIFNLYSRRLGPPEHREARYKNGIRFLEQVAAGKISLGANDPDPVPASEAPQIESPGRIFSRDSLRGLR